MIPPRRTVIFVLAAVLALSSGDAAGRPGPQESPDQALARYERMLKDAERYRSEKKYDFAANTLAEIIEGGVKRGDHESEFGQVAHRASLALADLRAVVWKEAERLLEQLEAVRDDVAGIDLSRVKRAERLLSGLRDLPQDTSLVTHSVMTKLAELRDACAAVGLARMSDEERGALETWAEELKGLADRTCATTDAVEAGRNVAQAEEDLSDLEKAASEAGTWQGLKKLDPEDGGIDHRLPGRLRKELDAIEDKLLVWKAAAADLSTFAPALAEDMRKSDAALVRTEALSAGIIVLFRAHLTINKSWNIDGALDRPGFPWLGSASVAADAVKRVHRTLRPAAALAELADILERPGKVETLVKGCRDDIDAIEARIEATDRTAGKCLADVEDARKDLNRARICLNTVHVRAQRAAEGTGALGRSGSTGTPSGTPSGKDPRTTTRPEGPPAQPPANPPPPPPAQASSAQNAVPPVRDDAYGGIVIQGGANEIPIGGSARFVATDMGNRPHPSVIWSSLNEEVLSMGADGTAVGLAEGPVTILAKLAEDPSVRAYRDIRVVVSTTRATDTAATRQAQGQAVTPSTPTGQTPARTPGQTTGQTTSGGFGDKGPPKVTPVAPGEVTDPEEGQKEDPGETRESESVNILGQTASVDFPDKNKKDQPQPGFPDESSSGFKDKGTKVRTAGEPSTTTEGDKTGTGQGTGSMGSGGQTRPVIRPLGLQGTGQPAAWHIFATGSRMGWAVAYARYTEGAADQDIVDHLVMAGEHAMWANRQSGSASPRYQAWPNWSDYRSRFRGWADQIVRGGTGGFREQIALGLSSYAGTMAEQVTFQVVGEKVQTPNCDGAYMRLGFALAFGQTGLQLAESAAPAGRERLAERARQDSVDHLRRAVRILSDYEHIKVVTGRCADLRDVRAEVESLLQLQDIKEQVRMTIHAWTTASDRIRALADQVAAPQREEETIAPDGESGEIQGEWVFAAHLFSLNPKENKDIREGRPNKWYDDKISNAWEAIERDRAADLHRVIIVKNGDRYVGRLAPGSYLGFPVDSFGGQYFTYRPGVEVLRLIRTGPNTYEGEYCWAENQRFNDNTIWMKTAITVKGNQFFQEMLSRSLFPDDHWGRGRKNRLTWIRLPER